MKKKNDTSKVIRVSLENYKKFTRLKKSMALKNKKEKVTYDEFFSETLNLAEALLEGREYYASENELFSDLADARGHAVRISRLSQTPVEFPKILIELGKDTAFEGKR